MLPSQSVRFEQAPRMQRLRFVRSSRSLVQSISTSGPRRIVYQASASYSSAHFSKPSPTKPLAWKDRRLRSGSRRRRSSKSSNVPRALALFRVFSTHAFTRTSSGWIFEGKMHMRLASGGKRLRLFRDSEKMTMSPSTRFLPGTLAAPSPYESLYSTQPLCPPHM
ncbi:hypothetical protein PENSPDRAFT_321305 [Peniophora sp. CONT]|nr:hypothetical protein PENSPDRAFT_321305 [Peniophora sp. CONT]